MFTVDHLKQLIDKIDSVEGDNVKLDISVYVELGEDTDEVPEEADYFRAVLIVEKPSNRTKIWLSPKVELASGYYVWNGDTVEKIPGSTEAFTKIRVVVGGSQGQEGWTQNDEMAYEIL